MCADFGNLKQEITELDTAGADAFHMDIMDGEFVSNFALSWHDFSAIRKITNKPMDVHLMVKNPSIHLPYAIKNQADIIYVHYESGNAVNYLYNIKINNIRGGLAINPETNISEIHNLFPLISGLLVMRVNPGFAGQPAVPEVEDKIKQLTKIKHRKFNICLDGCVGPDIIKKWSKYGVDEFVLGTASGMFGEKKFERSYSEIIKDLRQKTYSS